MEANIMKIGNLQLTRSKRNSLTKKFIVSKINASRMPNKEVCCAYKQHLWKESKDYFAFACNQVSQITRDSCCYPHVLSFDCILMTAHFHPLQNIIYLNHSSLFIISMCHAYASTCLSLKSKHCRF